jgi:hypothetical protein
MASAEGRVQDFCLDRPLVGPDGYLVNRVGRVWGKIVCRPPVDLDMWK